MNNLSKDNKAQVEQLPLSRKQKALLSLTPCIYLAAASLQEQKHSPLHDRFESIPPKQEFLEQQINQAGRRTEESQQKHR